MRVMINPVRAILTRNMELCPWKRIILFWFHLLKLYQGYLYKTHGVVQISTAIN